MSVGPDEWEEYVANADGVPVDIANWTNVTTGADDVPAMGLCEEDEQVHRDKLSRHGPLLPACVARPVGKAEIAREPKAEEALVKEWNKLRNAGVWDEQNVREWNDVATEARTQNTKAHMGRIFEICVEKRIGAS